MVAFLRYLLVKSFFCFRLRILFDANLNCHVNNEDRNSVRLVEFSLKVTCAGSLINYVSLITLEECLNARINDQFCNSDVLIFLCSISMTGNNTLLCLVTVQILILLGRVNRCYISVYFMSLILKESKSFLLKMSFLQYEA